MAEAMKRDLVGAQYGKLTVVARIGTSPRRPFRAIWLCRCACGNERTLTSEVLRRTAIDCGRHPAPIPEGPAISATEAAWAAGMFEGEGSVRLNKPTARNLGALLIDLPNTDESIVRWFHERWGGYFRRGVLAGNRKPYWRWRIASHVAASFLTAIYPHLRGEKRARVALALEFQAQKLPSSSFNRDEQYRDRQWSYYERMKALNARGAVRGTQLRLLASAETCPHAAQHRKERK